jgi:hypothetical protein
VLKFGFAFKVKNFLILQRNERSKNIVRPTLRYLQRVHIAFNCGFGTGGSSRPWGIDLWTCRSRGNVRKMLNKRVMVVWAPFRTDQKINQHLAKFRHATMQV